nr:immunoglobulin light chain junction region [Macaca mulatta]MOV37024.1 immunoglobulin light chain junction region [Macaca mulatta]MOV37038.1 immunoglobulin light chain junction region [Macaca mulatta]MOV37062.1 immunoglobulin light chain junction region [Macaca mulatta]MOV37078.1 immunoglobulin light chain junction region [Macaca mulatta]
CLQHDTYPFTF